MFSVTIARNLNQKWDFRNKLSNLQCIIATRYWTMEKVDVYIVMLMPFNEKHEMWHALYADRNFETLYDSLTNNANYKYSCVQFMNLMQSWLVRVICRTGAAVLHIQTTQCACHWSRLSLTVIFKSDLKQICTFYKHLLEMTGYMLCLFYCEVLCLMDSFKYYQT